MGIETILTGLAISAITSGASYGLGKLLAPKKQKQESTVATVGAPDPLNDASVIGSGLPGLFGARRISGKNLVQVKVGNVTYVVQVICGAQVTAIDAVYINNSIVSIDGSNNVTSEPWASSGSMCLPSRLDGRSPCRPTMRGWLGP